MFGKSLQMNPNISVLPSANSVLENIGFVYPFYVYDHDRQLAPTLRQDCAVWCMFIDSLDDHVDSFKNGYVLLYNGIEIPGIQSRFRIEYFSGEQLTMKVESNKIIEWSNE
jgi:hypothetical protein